MQINTFIKSAELKAFFVKKVLILFLYFPDSNNIATVFKFLLLDYLTTEKECFHIGLLFTCHFFVFLILYTPVQQIA